MMEIEENVSDKGYDNSARVPNFLIVVEVFSPGRWYRIW